MSWGLPTTKSQIPSRPRLAAHGERVRNSTKGHDAARTASRCFEMGALIIAFAPKQVRGGEPGARAPAGSDHANGPPPGAHPRLAGAHHDDVPDMPVGNGEDADDPPPLPVETRPTTSYQS